MPTADAVACEEALAEYLGGGDEVGDRVEAAYGPVDPFRRLPNGIHSITESLALVSTDPNDYPPLQGDTLPVAAILLGRLVSQSGLSPSRIGQERHS